MIDTGMIFQYDSDNEVGLIMLSDGATKEFTALEWIDKVYSPTIGQKIVYESSATGVQIKVATAQDVEMSLSSKSVFTSLDEYIQDFTSKGFKLVKETSTSTSRVAILRSFIDEEPEEVVIKESASSVNVVHTRNGKVIS